MNYNDEILENKTFNFFKQLMYNIALAICIMLVGVLILVYGFKFELYEVLSDSQAPYFLTGDMVVVKAQEKYEVGDIVTFNHNGKVVTHRLVAILKDGTTDKYICHGDNVTNVDGTPADQKWEDDRDFIEDLKDQGKNYSQIMAEIGDIQSITESQIKGKIVNHVDNYGDYFKFIKEHPALLIALVAGIWCISSCVQNEIDMKKSRRLI